jgi:hypothetical protein
MKSIQGNKLSDVSTLLNLRSSTRKLLIIFYQVKRIMSIPLPRVNPKEKQNPNPKETYYEEDEEEW